MKVRDPVNILLVDDQQENLLALSAVLEGLGERLVLAESGQEGLRRILEDDFAAILLDVQMPRMDGFETAALIRERDRSRHTPIIFVTALSTAEAHVFKGYSLGAVDYISKPVAPEIIKSKVAVFADLARKSQQIKRLNESLKKQALSLKSTNAELSRARDDLRVLNEQLEGLVAARTAELQQKNEELKATSQQLWQASKLAAVGELAASIAHELNNPMGIVALRIEALMVHLTPEDPRRRALEVIEQEVDRMAKLVSGILEFSRRSSMQISTVDVGDEIERTLELVHYHLRRRGVSVVREFQAGVPMVHADRQKLRQLFLNLFTNAGDAMPEGGTLTLRLRREDAAASSGGVAGRLVVEVADTGVGISPEHLSKVTEPFFTTKPEGKGTGLGLAICRRIVAEHKGSFEIESQVGLGTTVRITFPVPTGAGANSHLL